MAENKKPKVTIVDRVDHQNCVSLHIEFDPGDGGEIIEEKLNMGWDAMQLDAKGEPRYKHMIREWARQMKAIRNDKDIKNRAPKKGDSLEVD